MSLRSISSDNFVVVDTTHGDARHRRDRLHQRAGDAAREGDLHRRGQLYQVERLDFEGRKAFVREIDCDYYTDAITYTKVTMLDTFAAGQAPSRPDPWCASHGEVHVVSRVVGFKKIKFYTNENVGSGELDLPEQQMHTTSYWLTIPPARHGARCRTRPTIGATASSGWRSRCGRWRSCC